MVAALSCPPELRSMSEGDIDAVMAIERSAYRFPWSPGIFRDCLRSDYRCWVVARGPMVCGYGLVSVGAGEAHLLNLCVAASERNHGLGRLMLDHLVDQARSAGARQMFLEVRPSNHEAVHLYESVGFNLVSRRPGYYPADNGREDALVMAMELLPG